MPEFSTWIVGTLTTGGIVAAAAFVLRESFKSLLQRAELEASADLDRKLEVLRGEHARDLELLRASHGAELEVLKSSLGTEQEVRRLAAKDSMQLIVRLMGKAMFLELQTFHGKEGRENFIRPPTAEDLNAFNAEVREHQWLLPKELSAAFGTYVAKLGAKDLARQIPPGPEMLKMWNDAASAYDNLTVLVRKFVWYQRDP